MSKRFASLALSALIAWTPLAQAQDASQPYFRFNFGTVPKAVGVPQAQTTTDPSTGLVVQVPCLVCTGRTGAYMSFEPLVSNVPPGNYVHWFLSSGTLPAGLDLDTQTGRVFGTAGFTEPVQFALGVVDNRQVPVSTPTITFKTLDAVGVAYDSGTGKVLRTVDIAPRSRNVFGSPAYTVESGALPRGTTLDRHTGHVVGQVTNTVVGTRIRLSDSDGGFAVSAPFDIVTDAPELLYPATPYQVRTDIPVTTKATVFNMVQPYDAKLTGGTLPPGLRVEPSTANVVGTPTQAGTWGNVVVTVTDAVGTSKSSVPLSYVVSKPSVSYASGSTRVDRFYTVAPTVAALDAPRFYLTGGTLPDGITLDESTGNVQGTVRASGIFGGLIVTAIDGGGGNAVSAPFSITVAKKPTATANAIRGRANQALSMQGQSSDFPAAPAWTLAGPALPPGLALNGATGLVNGKVASAFAADGYVLTATAGDATAQTAPFSITVASPLAASMPPVQVHNGMSKTVPVTVTNALGSPSDLTMTASTPAPPTWMTVSGLNLVAAPPVGLANGGGSFTYVVKDTDGATVNAYGAAYNVGPLSLFWQPGPENLFTVGYGSTITIAKLTNAIGNVTGELLQSGSPAPNALAACQGLVLATTTDTSTGTALSTLGPVANGTCSVQDLTMRFTDADGSTVTTIPFSVVAEQTLSAQGPATLRVPQNVAADLPIRVTGGKPPFTFTRTAGTVPPGLPFDATAGSFRGTPTTIGTYSGLTVQVRDARNRAAVTPAFAITVAQQLVVANPSPDGAVDSDSYESKTMTTTGGTGPYTYQVVQGTLPVPAQLFNNTIQLTKMTAGTVARGLVVEATDSQGMKDRTDPFDIVVVKPLAVPTSADSAAGDLGKDFRMTFGTSGGVAPYTFSWATGYAPGAASAGFALSTGGVISARSDTPAKANVVVRVTDARGRTADTPPFLVSLAAPLVATLPQYTPMTYPRDGTSFFPNPTGGTGPFNWVLAPGYTIPRPVSFFPSGYITWPANGQSTFKAAFIVTDAAGRTSRTNEAEFVAAYELTHRWPNQTRSYPTGKGGGLTPGGVDTVYDVATYRQQSDSGDKNKTYYVGIGGGRGPYTIKIENLTVPPDILRSIDNTKGTISLSPRSAWTGYSAGDVRLTATDTSGQTVTTNWNIIHKQAPTLTSCEQYYTLYGVQLNFCINNLVQSSYGASDLGQEGPWSVQKTPWEWTYSGGPPGIQLLDAGRDRGEGTICGSTPNSSMGLWHMLVQGRDVNGALTQQCTVHIQVNHNK